MASVYRGLLMGRSSSYYKDLLRKIHSVSVNGDFTWVDVMRKFPEIGKSELSRLKCSNFLVKSPVQNSALHPVNWRLHPECQSIINPPVIAIKKKRKQYRPRIK